MYSKQIQTLAFVIFMFVLSSWRLAAQPTMDLLRIVIAPNHTDWTYKLGEKVQFNVSVTYGGNLLENCELYYEIGPEKMPATRSETRKLRESKLSIDGGTMKVPGFLKCLVRFEYKGKKYENTANVGFEPEKIQPTTVLPTDFMAFWDSAKAQLARVPIALNLSLLPERCTDKVNVYQLSTRNIQGSIYGILCVPKKEGRYPATILYPGAGIRPYSGDVANAEKGIITLQIGIHGIPVTLDPKVYNDLAAGALLNYQNFNLENREKYFYYRVILGCIRAIDAIFELPQFDGQNLAVYGGSQGGYLTLATAALDKRVKHLVCYFPAMCDVTGYLHQRAGGWPALFQDKFTNTPEKIATSYYFDGANFARFVTAPGLYLGGFNDHVCPPTSYFAAFNQIKAPKEVHLEFENRHWLWPEQIVHYTNWLESKLKQ